MSAVHIPWLDLTFPRVGLTAPVDEAWQGRATYYFYTTAAQPSEDPDVVCVELAMCGSLPGVARRGVHDCRVSLVPTLLCRVTTGVADAHSLARSGF